MYHDYHREAERHALSNLELKLVDAFLEDQDSSELTRTLATLSEALRGAEVLLLWRDLKQSSVQKKESRLFLN